jgi:hypothetical protein
MSTYFQRVERHSPIERMHESHIIKEQDDSVLLVHGFNSYRACLEEQATSMQESRPNRPKD